MYHVKESTVMTQNYFGPYRDQNAAVRTIKYLKPVDSKMIIEKCKKVRDGLCACEV